MLKKLIEYFGSEHVSLLRKFAAVWLIQMALVVLIVMLVGFFGALGPNGVVVVGISIWALIVA